MALTNVKEEKREEIVISLLPARDTRESIALLLGGDG